MARLHPSRSRTRRTLVTAAVSVVLVLTGGPGAFAAEQKPGQPQKVLSGQDAKVAPSLLKRLRTTSANAGSGGGSSPTSVSSPSTTTAPKAPLPSGTPSKDPALRTTDMGALPQDAGALRSLRTKAAANGSVRVIVTFDTRFAALGTMGTTAAQAQTSTLLDLSDQVSAIATARGGTVNRTYGGNVPAVALTVTPAALAALEASPMVAQIQPDGLNQASDATTTPLIGASDAHDRGFHGGGGSAVVVLDTGAQYDHPSYSGRVTNAACFSAESDCPNGSTSQFGGNSGQPCTFAAACDHGTHVTGIAAGGATASYAEGGVADQAKIETIRVFHQGVCPNGSVCPLAWDSDIIAGLNQAYADRGIGTASVNISIGGGQFTSNCDSAQSTMKSVIDNLRSVNIATVVAAGNDGFTNAVSSPACISTAITIGATTNSDAVASFSNSSAQVDLYAPGVGVLSSLPGSLYGTKSGTSMATPQVVGSIAVIRSALGSSVTVPQMESYLGASGPVVADSKSGIARHRINVLQAIGQEVRILPSNSPIDSRDPVPYSHKYVNTSTVNYWSVVGVRPPAGADYDITLYDNADFTGSLGSSAYGGSTVDFVALDGNRRTPRPDNTYPLITRFTGTGRYQIEYANDGVTIGEGATTVTMGSGELLLVRDTYQSAGAPTYYRAVPTNGGQDVSLFLMQSVDGTVSTYTRSRSAAAATSASNGAGEAEGFAYTATASQYGGLVVVNQAGSGTYTLYKDTSAPTGTVTINNGDAATASTSVTLTLSAADGQTGVQDMRVSTDGTFDDEPWEPYVTSKGVTIPGGAFGDRTVSVQFRNNAGMTTTSSDTIAYAAAPAVPNGTTATPTAPDAITVGFTPGTDNGSPTTSYSAQCVSSDGGATRSANGVASPISVTGLDGGKTYRCRVRATNAVGTSAYGAYTGNVSTPPATAPGKPTITSTTPSAGAIAVAFGPAPANGSTVTSYAVTCTSTDGGVGRTATGAASPVSVQSVTAGKHYQCRVRATNGVGAGAYSAYGSTVEIPAAVAPGAPTISASTPSAGAVTVTWAAPANNGGSAITSFSLQCLSTDGGPTGSASAASAGATQLTVNNLAATKSYRCRVRAANAAGTGGYSAYGATVVLPAAAAPGSPTVTGSTAAAGAVKVTFAAPANNGGDPISAYTVQCVSSNGGASGSADGTASPVTVGFLTPGKSYTCRARATNGAGTGAFGSAGSAVTPTSGPPPGVLVTGVTPAVGSAGVAFQAPGDGGSPITGYGVSCTSTDGGATSSASGSASPLTVSGLTAGKNYKCRVRATTALGTGTYGAYSAPFLVPAS